MPGKVGLKDPLTRWGRRSRKAHKVASAISRIRATSADPKRKLAAGRRRLDSKDWYQLARKSSRPARSLPAVKKKRVRCPMRPSRFGSIRTPNTNWFNVRAMKASDVKSAECQALIE